MDEQQRTLAEKILRIINPVFLLAIVMFYFMGAGIYRYLGGTTDWVRFSTGLACVFLLHCSSMLFNAFFDMQKSKNLLSRFSSNKYKEENFRVESKFILSAGLTTLATGNVLFFVLVIQNALSPASFLVYIFAFLASILYSVPPYKLSSRGMGEIVITILISNLYPAFAFLLQNEEMHRLVAIITFPLTPLLLASMISSGLSTYLQDMIDQKMTLLRVLQWKMGMDIHNLLILICYIILGMAVILDLSWILTWPFLLTLPLSLLSVNEVIRIKNGIKPRWAVLFFGSFGSIGCTVYLITFALWTG